MINAPAFYRDDCCLITDFYKAENAKFQTAVNCFEDANGNSVNYGFQNLSRSFTDRILKTYLAVNKLAKNFIFSFMIRDLKIVVGTSYKHSNSRGEWIVKEITKF